MRAPARTRGGASSRESQRLPVEAEVERGHKVTLPLRRVSGRTAPVPDLAGRCAAGCTCGKAMTCDAVQAAAVLRSTGGVGRDV